MQLNYQKKKQAIVAKELLEEQLIAFFSAQPSSEKTDQLIRLAVPISSLNPLTWLAHQTASAQVYWSDRFGQDEIAGIGEAIVIESAEANTSAHLFHTIAPYLQQTPDIRFYGGFRFNPKIESDELWKTFGSYRFVIPRFEVAEQNHQTTFACHFKLTSPNQHHQQLETLLQELDTLCFDITEQAMPKLQHDQRTDTPVQEVWHEQINQALTSFQHSDLDKVVLARRATLDFPEPVNPILLLERLKHSTPEAFHFCFQPQDQTAFIGASPECLYRRQKQKIWSEAIAGTRLRGQTEAQDHKLGQKLLTSEKEQREHEFVSRHVQDVLNPLCESFETDQAVSLLKLSRVQHLCRRFQGILKPDITDKTLLSALHPTPAVGAFPAHKAQSTIAELENFDRGWYAGPVGWISADAAEFAVAIRSGLIHQHQLHLFSGAGIVEGSEPAAEWGEIESKIGNFMSLFDV